MEVTGPTMYKALGIGMDRAFGDDVLRYSLCSFELQPLEQMPVAINRRLKRKKVFDSGRVAGRIVAALDGVEVLSSYSRCCDSCLERRIPHQGPGSSLGLVSTTAPF